MAMELDGSETLLLGLHLATKAIEDNEPLWEDYPNLSLDEFNQVTSSMKVDVVAILKAAICAIESTPVCDLGLLLAEARWNLPENKNG